MRKRGAFEFTIELSSIEVRGVPVGVWTIQIDAINRDGISIAHGEETVVITEAQTSELTVNVAPYAGFGIIMITVEWDPDLTNPILQGVISQKNGSRYNLEFDISGNRATASVTAAAGYYSFTVNLYDATGARHSYVVGAVQIVRIVEDEITPGVFQIIANSEYGNGDVEIGIIVDMKDPILIELAGQVMNLL